MIRPEVLEELERVADDDLVTLVLVWEGPRDRKGLESLPDISSRRVAVRDYFGRKKAALIDWAKDQENLEFNDLDGSGNAVLTARKRDWTEFVRNPNSPLHERDVVVLPNVRFYPD